MKLIVTCLLAVCLLCAESKREGKGKEGGGKKKLMATIVALEGRLNELDLKYTGKIVDLDAKINTMKLDADVATVMAGIKVKAEVKTELKAEVKTEVMAEVMAEVKAEVKAEVEAVEKPASNLVIASSEGAAGDENCARICSGTTGRGSTDWTYFNNFPGFYADVDMTACGFVKTPIITASLGGDTYHWRALGSNAIFSGRGGPSTTSFRVYLSMSVMNDAKYNQDYAKEKKWKIEWMAVGYTC